MTKRQKGACRAALTQTGQTEKRNVQWRVVLSKSEAAILDKKAAQEGLSRPELILKYCLSDK